MNKIDVYGNEGGFSLWFDTPSGKFSIGLYGKLRVELTGDHSITISKGPQWYHGKDFYINIVRDEDELDIFIQTSGICQTRMQCGHVDDELWQKIVAAAKKAEEESATLDDDQEEYESE